MNGMRLYLRMAGLSVRGQMRYKANLAMLIVGQFFGIFTEYVGIWALFERFGTFGNWGLYEASLCYGMAHMSFALCEFFMRGFFRFSGMVKSGDFDKVLVRPRSPILLVMGTDVQMLRLGRFALGLAVFCTAAGRMGLRWNGLQWALCAGSVLSGGAAFAGIIVLQAAASFFVLEVDQAFNAFSYGGVQLAQYPLSEYKKGIKHFFLYVLPLGCMNFVPLSVLLGKGQVSNVAGWLSPLVGPMFLGLCLGLWRMSMGRYTSAGG